MGLLGIRFHPRDEELIRYLLKFVSCKNYLCDNIRLDDLYGNKKPWDIFESNSTGGDGDAKKVKYFFTKLKKKKSDGRRFIRTVIGGGSWKGLDGEKPVYDGLKLVGSKKNYRYQYKGYQADDVVWTMREYSLDEKILKALRRRSLMHYEDVVLCCVKRKINVHARDHKELSDCMPMEITSGDEFAAAMDATLQTTQQYDSCLLNRFTSSDEHNNVFHELQQDQNSEQLINQVQNIEDVAPFAQNHNGYVASYIEQGTANFQDSCPVYPFTSSEHNYAFQELQQDQNSEQVNVVQGNNIEERVPFAQYHNDDVTSYSVEGATNFRDYTGANFSSTLADLQNDSGTQPQLPICINVHARDHKELGDYMPMEIPSGHEVVAAMNGTLLTTQQHDSCLLNSFTSSEHNNVFHEFQQDQNSEQLINQVQTIDEMVSSAQNHNDDVTSYSEKGATNFQDYDIDCYTGADFSSTLADLLNDIGTQPQLPICIDESGCNYQLPQQIGSTCMVLNEGNTDVAAFVSDQWSACCEDQVQNLEEAAPITFTEPTAPLAINSDECFSMEGLFDIDDFIAADFSWASDLFD
ncbi:NAC domain containing protein 50-like [Capsicum galapagoense]